MKVAISVVRLKLKKIYTIMIFTESQLPIVGTICGDIIGSSYERKRMKDYDFEMFPPRTRCTDDSVCTVAVAEALVEGEKFEDALRRWCNKYPRAGYGRAFKAWIADPEKGAYNSWGNGSAMRVSACGVVAKTLGEALELAKKSAEVTHDHPEGIKGAQATAAAIFLARHGATKEEIKEEVERLTGYDLSRRYDDIKPGYKFASSCQLSVPESIICFLEGKDYEDTVRLAVAMGGDSDTMAAIAGGIAAAYYKEIPEHLLTPCMRYLKPGMKEVIDRYRDL